MVVLHWLIAGKNQARDQRFRRAAANAAEQLLARGFSLPKTRRPPRRIREHHMGKGILLWLIGVPIPVILLLWLFFH